MLGKIDGYALRVPSPTVSITDLVVETEKNVTIEEVNALILTHAHYDQMFLKYSVYNICGSYTL